MRAPHLLRAVLQSPIEGIGRDELAKKDRRHPNPIKIEVIGSKVTCLRKGWKPSSSWEFLQAFSHKRSRLIRMPCGLGKTSRLAFECAQVRFHSGLTGMCDKSNGGKENTRNTGGFWRSFCLFNLLDWIRSMLIIRNLDAN